MIVVAVVKFDIPPNGTVRPGSTSAVFGKPILTVPAEISASHFHSSDHLTLMGVGLQHCEGGVRGENDGIGGVTVSTAAVLDVSILVVHPVWKRP